MFVLENLLGLKSKQADGTATFLHATLGEDEKVYKELPLGFKQHSSNENSRLFVSRKLFMACIKVLMISENISLKNMVTVAYLKLLLTPA